MTIINILSNKSEKVNTLNRLQKTCKSMQDLFTVRTNPIKIVRDRSSH